MGGGGGGVGLLPHETENKRRDEIVACIQNTDY